MDLKNAKELVKRLFKRQLETGERFSVEIESGPGLGKSEGIQQVTEELSLPEVKGGIGQEVGFNPFFLSTIEQPDVRGFAIPSHDAEGTPIMSFTKAPWVPGPDDPKHGILFLDEFRQSAHDVQKPAAELLLNGRVGGSELPNGWMVVAASNREKDKSGVQRELSFISNRRMLISLTPNLDAWVEWAEVKDIHWAAIAFAKAHTGDVFGDSVPEKGGPFCTPRTLVKMSYLIDVFPSMAMFTEAAAGLVGEGVGAKFTAFLRVVDELPSYEEIVKDPKGCKIPAKDRPDAQYATMQMIAHRTEGKTAPAAFQYLKRMSQEFQIAGLKATLRRCPEIVRTPEFATWLRDNKELIVNANLLDRK
jgi:hypothetical protein